jgi:3-isopropylmalate/(R)-2-methylmalate dehydratase large subunit
MEARMTICNMSIEFGARMGLIAVDDRTIGYVKDRPFAPRGMQWDQAVAYWHELHSDDAAVFDKEIRVDSSCIQPQISWGTSPDTVIAVNETVPEITGDAVRRESINRMLKYMGLESGQRLEGIPIDYAFIGSCTNSRLSDLEAAAAIVRGRRVAPGVTALVVPGSMQVKASAEALGLDRVFIEAGFEWRNAGCSMCVASNGDFVPPGKRAISTTNRNFQHRQGPQSRTHLASPATVAASAVTGQISDVRKLMQS